MKLVLRKSSKCTSAQKVTAALLLSFLTLGSSALVSAVDNVEQNEAQHILQVPGSGKDPVQSHLGHNIHKFVR
jgi:hypothetical protein